MKCRYSNEDIALYVEGDLKEPELRDIEAHLPVCDACRGLAAELRESQSLFKTLRQDTVSGASLVQVRTRVLSEVHGVNSTTAWGRRLERYLYQGLRRGYALAGAGFAVLICLGLWYALRPGGEAVQHVVERALLPPAPAVLSEPVVVPVTRRSNTVRPVQHKAAARAETGEPAPPKQLVVKLLTDDPNIVIYWLVDENGG